ncbi:hypothetical protein ASE69_15710 [Sphingomonas sp. Leaf208]|nr:hypothetical protein ASE69_15710 [Sphingomonas sp. Leaf208]
MRICGWSAHRARAAATAVSDTSSASNASHRAPSRAVRTPFAQPTSNAFSNRSFGNAASVSSYFAASYGLVSNAHGSPLSL